jgi:hypothetical protein
VSYPSVATIKRLFAVSGNECAFPGCANPLVDAESGKVTGRICHITGKKPGTARYDASQSDTERDAFENLLLMCPIHHDVIDTDVQSYTVERLQRIKAEHEALSGAGPEVSDDIAVKLLASIDGDVAIVLNAEADAEVRWTGDILHGGTKIVVGSLTQVKSEESTWQFTVRELIRDIQLELYGDNRRLPYVLALCLELCEKTGVSDEYTRWLNRELRGYDDYARFQDEFRSGEDFEAWMDKWASHRWVTTHIKAQWRSAETMRLRIDELPFDSILLGMPVAQIVRDLEEARRGGLAELSVPLLNLGQAHYARLQSSLDEKFPGNVVPPDVRVYWKVSEVDRVLDGVRNIVLSLLKDARSLLE